jgi:PKHD-type hydroxylase
MLLDQWFFFQEGGIQSHTCEEIIKYGNSLNPSEGVTGSTYSLLDDDEKRYHSDNIRNSKTSWIKTPWIYTLLKPIVSHANNSSEGWNFNISDYEAVQFTKYLPNGHYNWHNDVVVDNRTNLMRKLSMIVQLSNPKDYEGGKFRFNLRGLDSMKEDTIIESPKEFRTQGSIIIFPSYLWHKVETITKGTRYSLVMWSLGESFK